MAKHGWSKDDRVGSGAASLPSSIWGRSDSGTGHNYGYQSISSIFGYCSKAAPESWKLRHSLWPSRHFTFSMFLSARPNKKMKTAEKNF